MGQDRAGRWPSRWPAWTVGAVVVGVAVFACGVYLRHRSWTPLQRFYLEAYARSGLRAELKSQPGEYAMLYWVAGERATLAEEANASYGSRGAKLRVRPVRWRNAELHTWLRSRIYAGRSPWAILAERWRWGAIALVVGLAFAIPKDLERIRARRQGERLRGTELVTTRRFNARNRSDGIGFLNEDRRLLARWLAPRRIPRLRIPRAEEAKHLLIMGDSGTGKSALIHQLLLQVQERGETAIVYDPALEYTPRFFSAERGDVVLNPLDARMPYWSPGEEVRHEAEALSLAASLFPERPQENPFFPEGAKKVFAHLLACRPRPEELSHWLCHEEEIDRRVSGSELAAVISPAAPQQRQGVLGSLNMVADSLKLLPREDEAPGKWSAAGWVAEREGWLFLTSTPEYRERLRPLTSLWLDLLILRVMNHGLLTGGGRVTWFVLDELASLQKLPQLHTALTENRKSGNPVVLGFQGRSQLEKWYGHEAEAMFSQPATKVFLRTSEPQSAKWISETIGQVEVQRVSESRTRGEIGRPRSTRGQQLGRELEDLVIPSQVMGLEKLCGYLKYENFAVRLRTRYVEPPKREPAFVPRTERRLGAVPAPLVEATPVFFE
jgi:hypothetical protein